jgi:DNA-binding transcriptional LysR family regulator
VTPDVLADPLFMRIPSGLQPTERAHQLAPRLRVALAEIRSAVATPIFDPAMTRQRFVIASLEVNPLHLSSRFSAVTVTVG